jgi:hypothetical protein
MRRAFFIDWPDPYRWIKIFARRWRRARRGQVWPPGWLTDEIEAKWLLDESTLFEIIDDLRGSSLYGYQLSIRFGGVARMYHDIYYDTPDGRLFKARHSLRARTRSTSSPLAPSNDFSTLESANWAADWHRFQFKRFPWRVEAVWFRKELQSAGNFDGAPGSDFLPQNFPTDVAVTAVVADHPDIDLSTLQPVLENVAYRYRVQLSKPGSRPLQEISLDQVKSRTLPGGLWDRFNEFEVEALPGAEGGTLPQSSRNVWRLFGLTDEFEVDYPLTRSTRSKGGVYVREYGDTVVVGNNPTI